MHRENTPHPSGAQYRRLCKEHNEWVRQEREKKRVAHDHASIAGYCDTITQVAGHFDADRAEIARAISEMMDRTKRHCQSASRRACALHEGGHFIVAHTEGLKPFRAKIEGSPGDRYGYDGEVEIRLAPSADADASADDILASARTYIAGPASEEFFSAGQAIHRIGELMIARACVSRAALMTGRDRDETWSRMVAETLVILSVNFWLVREAAEMLEKRREISCADRSVKRLLASAVRPKDHDLDLIAHTHEARDILRSLQEVPDVLREVRK